MCSAVILSGCGTDLRSDSMPMSYQNKHRFEYQANGGVSQTEINSLKFMVAELLQDSLAADFSTIKLPTKIYILDGLPTLNGNVDSSNTSSGFIRVFKGLSKGELSQGLFSLGMKDNKSGLVVVPSESTDISDVIRIRNLTAEVTNAVKSSSFIPVKRNRWI
jgi:hypothetical protein